MRTELGITPSVLKRTLEQRVSTWSRDRSFGPMASSCVVKQHNRFAYLADLTGVGLSHSRDEHKSNGAS